MKCSIIKTLFTALLLANLMACSTPASGPAPVGQAAITRNYVPTAAATMPPWLLHLPGIGGKRSIDVSMTRGFVQGGFKGDVEIYDWTENDSGLHALIAQNRNHREAKMISEKITARFDMDPTAPIYVSCHSGGSGLAVWALEDLPPRVKINTLIMMSPALSPGYDLSAALRHVTGKLFVFSSQEDELVLGTGCRLMGTIDGAKTEAAGKVGFVRPPNGDAGQYAKLVAMPYKSDWIHIGNYGDHVGGMNRMFAQAVLAPLVLTGTLPMEFDTLPTPGPTPISTTGPVSK